MSEKLLGKTDSGFFGKGFYFTSFIEYALFYQFHKSSLADLETFISNQNNEFRIMFFLVNLGICEEFNEKYPCKTEKDWNSVKGKDFIFNIDSRHVLIGQQAADSLVFVPSELTPNSKLFFDEYIIKDKYHSLPQFTLKFILTPSQLPQNLSTIQSSSEQIIQSNQKPEIIQPSSQPLKEKIINSQPNNIAVIPCTLR